MERMQVFGKLVQLVFVVLLVSCPPNGKGGGRVCEETAIFQPWYCGDGRGGGGGSSGCEVTNTIQQGFVIHLEAAAVNWMRQKNTFVSGARGLGASARSPSNLTSSGIIDLLLAPIPQHATPRRSSRNAAPVSTRQSSYEDVEEADMLALGSALTGSPGNPEEVMAAPKEMENQEVAETSTMLPLDATLVDMKFKGFLMFVKMIMLPKILVKGTIGDKLLVLLKKLVLVIKKFAL